MKWWTDGHPDRFHLCVIVSDHKSSRLKERLTMPSSAGISHIRPRDQCSLFESAWWATILPHDPQPNRATSRLLSSSHHLDYTLKTKRKRCSQIAPTTEREDDRLQLQVKDLRRTLLNGYFTQKWKLWPSIMLTLEWANLVEHIERCLEECL